MSSQIDFQTQQASPLIGATVTGLAKTPPDDMGDEYFGIELQKGNTDYVLWFLRDEEGNGPGAFEIDDGTVAADYSGIMPGT